MKLKIYLSGKYVYVPADNAQDFVDTINRAMVWSDAQEKKHDGTFVPAEPLALELRAE